MNRAIESISKISDPAGRKFTSAEEWQSRFNKEITPGQIASEACLSIISLQKGI
jgi:hypothetical protein